MQRYEYRVIPAPRRGEKARGLKTTEDRFAFALTQVMNTLGAEGWDYVRADTLPCDERAGLTGSKTSYQNMLVFRRPLSEQAVSLPAEAVEVPALAAPPAQGAAPAFSSLRAAPVDEAAPVVRLGAAQGSVGHAPFVGPAKPEVAAE